MKILEKFESLEAAIAYILLINSAFKKEETDRLAAEAETKKIKTALDLEASTTKDLKERVKELSDFKTDALEQIAELGEKLDLTEKNRGDKSLIVAHNKKNYKLLGDRFFTRKGSLNAEELVKDTELINEMIKNGSGSLIPIE